MPATNLTAYLPDGFFSKLKVIARRRNLNPEHALAVMLFESGIKPTSIHPSAPASGLFGKMFPTRAEAEAFIRLSAEEQLDHYDRFMAPYTNVPKPAAENIYQLNFLPASAIPGQKHYRGTHDEAVLAARGGTGYGGKEDLYYRENAVLDRDKDGAITVRDLRTALEDVQRSNAAKWAEIRGRLAAAPDVLPPSPAAPPLLPLLVVAALAGGAVYAAQTGLLPIRLPAFLRG